MNNSVTFLENFDSRDLENVIYSASNGTPFPYRTDIVEKILLDYNETNVTSSCFRIPILNYFYNDSKIQNLYDVSIVEQTGSVINEIVESTNDTQNFEELYNQVINENETIKNQLNTLLAQNFDSSQIASVSAAKDIIISLRIKLNEGKSTSDFSDVYPYLPK